MSRMSLIFALLLAVGCAEGAASDESGSLNTGRGSVDISADTLMGVHSAGNPEGSDLFAMMDGHRGFTVELAYSEDPSWMPDIASRLQRLTDRGLTAILRLDYTRDLNIPPPGQEDGFVSYVRDTVIPQVGGSTHIFVIGNEPNMYDGCRHSPDNCTPEHYADVYRRVRGAVSGDYLFLVAGVSPGPADAYRHMNGNEYLRRVLGALRPGEVDGYAMHAYGGGNEEQSVSMFTGHVSSQLGVLGSTGHGGAAVFITEMNRQTTGGVEDETITAGFLRRAYAWVNEHNRGGTQDIVGACWFVYEASADWRTYSLLGLKNGGDDDMDLAGSDVWHAFRASAREGFPPGEMQGGFPPPADPTPADPPEDPSAACNPPDSVEIGGRCVPSCGRAGGDTCDSGATSFCDGYTLLESWDCTACCSRGAAPSDPPPEDPPAEDPPDTPPPACDPPDSVEIDGRCVPSCGRAGGDTCDTDSTSFCDGYRLLESWDCTACCDRSAAPSDPPPEDPPDPPPDGECPCRSDGVANFCLYPVRTENCGMTWPGGYCDPNGDGSFTDGDWDRGWYDYRDQCG
jgi:hypothetical protein